jgi:hypothetical protein
MKKAFQLVWRGLLPFLLIFARLTGTENWFAAGPLQQEQTPKKESEPGGPKQTESDTVIGPKKQAPPKKRAFLPRSLGRQAGRQLHAFRGDRAGYWRVARQTR